MAQSSGPISQGTTAERQFTDVQWRDLFGDEPGVIGDLDGTSYALNLSGGGDVVNVGSTTQISMAKVAGFAHRIPQSNPEPITIPAAVGSTRTDIIGLRYDPAYTGLPGPVRLYRTVGSSASVPSYDASPPGVEDLPLFSITRAVGQALSLATVTRMFPRLAPSLDLPAGASMPTSSPLGTLLRVGKSKYRRELVAGTPTWVSEDTPVVGSVAARDSFYSGNLYAGAMAIVNGYLHLYTGSQWKARNGGKVQYNVGAPTTDAGGAYVFPHGLGAAPRTVQITTGQQASDLLQRVGIVKLLNWDASNIVVSFSRTDTSAYLGGSLLSFDWEAAT